MNPSEEDRCATGPAVGPLCEPPVARRRRDPEASRRAILDAARHELYERGYGRMTIRGVAARAGVTHGLVMRHFGSKEGLLHASIQGPDDLDTVLAGDAEELPERIATAFVERMEAARSSDRMVALIRSAAADDPLATSLYLTMQAQSARAYRAVLTGPDVDERVDLLGSVLLGVTFSRYVVRAGTLATMKPAELSRHLAELLRPIVHPADRGPTETGV
ncbi:TetR family transcriptional regulator [Streptomyces sp. NPDC058665]|uniref:TetR/AcrR family transcriptional regulator n=1 Tax=Streptomyces sp. NPDC058665 TaxID=3346586 RepID=UPI00366012DD